MKESINKTDCNGTEIFEGDQFIIPKHLDSSCCFHNVKCTIKWNAEWKAYGLQDNNDGEWLTGMGIISAFKKESSN